MVDNDLSDDDFEQVKQKFISVLLPKYGVLYKSLLQSQKSQKDDVPATNESEEEICTTECACCQPMISFVPTQILSATRDNDGAENQVPDDSSTSQATEANTVALKDDDGEQDLDDDSIATDDRLGEDNEAGPFGLGSVSRRQSQTPESSTLTRESDNDIARNESDSNCSSDESHSSDESTRVTWEEWSTPEQLISNENLANTAADANQDSSTNSNKGEEDDVESRQGPPTSDDELPGSQNVHNYFDQESFGELRDTDEDDDDDTDNNNDDDSVKHSVAELSSDECKSTNSQGPKSTSHKNDDELAREAEFDVDGMSSDEEERRSPFPTRATSKSNMWRQNNSIQSDNSSSSMDDQSENEWTEADDEQSSCSKGSEPSSTMNQLVDLTNQITIDSEEDSDRENRVKATKSKAQFKREREALAERLFITYDQTFCSGRLSSCTTVTWNKKLGKTAGQTRLKRNTLTKTRTAVIELSTKVIDDDYRLRNTLVHEMVHAAAFVIDGAHRPPHGKAFWKWANIAMSRLPGITVTTTHSYEIDYKYAWGCSNPNCPVVIKRHSRSVDTARQICGRCGGSLIEIEVPSSSGATKSHVPRKKAVLSEYNVFVKEINGQVRHELQQKQGNGQKVSQAQVMKECARRWRLKQGKMA